MEVGSFRMDRQSAEWPTDPAFSRNPKPPALAGGVFTSKDEILRAVIQLRLENTRRMLAQFERDDTDPAAATRRFIHILLVNGDKIKRYGSPLGTLTGELAKLNHGLQKKRTGCSWRFATGCAGSLPGLDVPKMPMRWRCIFLPSARA